MVGKEIHDKEYEHVLNVRNKFEMKIMKDYHKLYFKCKVLLLPDVFEKFTDNNLKHCDCTRLKLRCDA